MAKVALYAGIAVLAVIAAPVALGVIGGGIVGGGLIGGLAGAAAGLGTFVGASGTAAAIAAWGTVALAAGSALSSMRPKVGEGAAGSAIDFQADPNAGIPLMLGRSATAGKVIHANTSGQADKNKALMFLLALTGGPLGGFESLTASDFLVTFDVNGKATAPTQYADAMFLQTTPGLKPESQAYWPLGVPQSSIPEWTSAHLTSGVACAWWTLLYDTTKYSAGVPKPLFVIRGPAVYDPRADSTYPGGVGAQRWDDATTWSLTGNDNPFLQALTWCIGRFDAGKLSFGIGAPISGIDVAAFVEGANVADANGWKVGGEVLSSDKKWDVLTTILQAGGGEPIKLGGMISAYVRTPRVVLGTLVGADLVGDASITGTKRRRDRINQIIPSYRSEDHQWTVVPAGPVFVNEYIAADGGLRSREGSYPLVQDAGQVAQLATYDILDAREFEPVVLPVGPHWQGIRPGDCISINEPEFGLDNQQVIIQTREFDLASGRVTLTCRSETPGKHDYALGRTPNPPPIPGLNPLNPNFVARPDPGIWTAWGGVLTGADGTQVPAIVVTGHCNDPNVSGIIVEYQLELSVGPPATFGGWVSAEFPSTTTRMEFRSVISGATYHVQVRYRSVRNVEGALAEDLGLVTVGTSISGGVTQIGGQTPQELIDQLNQTTQLGLDTADQATQTASDLLFTNQNLYDSTHLPDGTDLETYTVNAVNAGLANNAYSITRVDAMGVLRPDGHTFQLSDTTLYADPTTTWGSYKQSLATSIGNNSAAITTEQTARISGDQANATSITNVNTKADANTASITTLQSSVNGLNAQWVLSVSSTGPGYAQVAGIKVAANPTVSSIAFVASQIGFTDGSSNVFPLAVVGGKVIATNFQADDIKANTITTNKIVANNIAQTTQASAPNTTLTTSFVQTISVVLNCSGGYIDVDIWANAQSSGANDTFSLLVTLDGSSTIGDFGAPIFTTSGYNQATGKTRIKPAAGNHTFAVQARKYQAGSTVQLVSSAIWITDQKTQA